jgi:hypothetical protein
MLGRLCLRRLVEGVLHLQNMTSLSLEFTIQQKNMLQDIRIHDVEAF